jgi:hypothetical protein
VNMVCVHTGWKVDGREAAGQTKPDRVGARCSKVRVREWERDGSAITEPFIDPSYLRMNVPKGRHTCQRSTSLFDTGTGLLLATPVKHSNTLWHFHHRSIAPQQQLRE